MTPESKTGVLDHLYHLASFMPGIGLTLGYLFAWITTLASVPNKITVIDEVAIRHQQQVGEIPNWRFEFEPDMGTSPITVEMPETDAFGKPILKRVEKVVTGRGKPTIYIVSQTEVTIPVLGTPPFHVERRQLRPGMRDSVIRRDGHPEFIRKELLTAKERDDRRAGGFGVVMLDYSPNIEQRKTSVHEIERSVRFDPYFDQNSVSIWWGIAGTVLGLAIYYGRFLLRKSA